MARHGGLGPPAGEGASEQRGRARSAQALVVYGLTMICASIDWAMSLEPHWYTGIYALRRSRPDFSVSAPLPDRPIMMSHAKAVTSSEHPPNHSSVGLYLRRYLFLLVLLAATVAFMTLAIVSVKAWLVAMNFMHLRESLRLTWLIAAGTFLWLAVLIVGRLMDFATRTPSI